MIAARVSAVATVSANARLRNLHGWCAKIRFAVAPDNTKMTTAICVCGPYHGMRERIEDLTQGVVVVDGAKGPARYVLHHQISPGSSLYAFDGCTEEEVVAAVLDLAKRAI